MFKNGVLTINYDTWKPGIAPSPYVGLGDLRNADIHTTPGALLCGFKAIKDSSTTVTDFVKFMAHDDEDNETYALDDSGNLYRRGASSWSKIYSNQVSGANGMIMWKRHLIIADDLNLSVYDIDGDNWEVSLEAFAEGQRNSQGLPHTMYIGQDDVVYITDGIYIASLTEVAGKTFNPSDGTTYTWNAQALDLPSDYVANTLNEYGDALIIGTYFNEVLNRGNRADTFAWTPTSSSGTYTFDDTKKVKGNGVWQAATQGNIFYQVIDRNAGKLYVSNLSSYELIAELKNIAYGDSVLKIHPDAVEIIDDQLLFGIGSNDSGQDNLGVYGYKNGTLHIQNTLSCGDTQIEIGSIINGAGYDYYISWDDDTTYGIDKVSNIRMDSYGTALVSPLYTVGTALEPASFTQMDVELGKPLASGEGVRVSYRTSPNDSWSTLQTLDYDTYGAVSYMNAEANLADIRKIQVKVELTVTEGATSSPEFISLNIF